MRVRVHFTRWRVWVSCCSGQPGVHEGKAVQEQSLEQLCWFPAPPPSLLPPGTPFAQTTPTPQSLDLGGCERWGLFMLVLQCRSHDLVAAVG